MNAGQTGEPVNDSDIDRRRLAKGVAWSVPVIVAASVAPAVAASPALSFGGSGRVTYNRSWRMEYIDNSTDFKLFSTPAGTSQPGQGICVYNTNSSMKITNAKVTYYLPYSTTLRFTAPSAGPGANGWSMLTRDATQLSKYYNGVYYYAYTTTYTGPVTAQNGTTCLPSYGFESNSGVSYTGFFHVAQSVQVDGQTFTDNHDGVRMVS